MSFEKVSQQQLNEQKAEIKAEIGDLSALPTTDKSSVVAAVNELFMSAGNGKAAIAAAITGKGIDTSASDSFAQMAENISQIETGITPTGSMNSKCFVVTLDSDPATGQWYYFNTANSEIATHINDPTFVAVIINTTDSTTQTYRTIGGVAVNHKLNSYNNNASYGVYMRTNSAGATGYAGYANPVTDTSTAASGRIAVTSDGRLCMYCAANYKFTAGTYVAVCGW